MYRDTRGNGNFGDELSEIILKFLFEKYSISDVEISLNKSKENNLVFIGSLIYWANNNYNNIHLLGTGLRTENDSINKNIKMKIHSVRGPLTKQYLENFNYNVSNIYGDPALLLSKFYNPNKISLCRNKIGVVGHITNFHKYNSIPDNYIMINPTWKWEKVVDYIYSCDIILSSSLHGLIIADAYNIPNIWLDEFPLNEGHFKFKDYFLSQNRKYENINNINDYKNIESYKKGNIIDLNKIEFAFMNMCIELNLVNFFNTEAFNDKFISCYFNHKQNGYYIECGATDGIINSSCYFLEKHLKWNGICIEANPEEFDKLKNNRSALCISNPISKKNNEEIDYVIYKSKWLSGIKDNTLLDEYRLNKFKDSYSILNTIKLKTISLYELLNMNNSPINIDCLCMDIEGSEYDVLDGYFEQNDKYKIKLIIFESPCCKQDFYTDLPNIIYKYDTIENTPIYKLLIKNNYVRIYNPYIPLNKKTEIYFELIS